MKLQLAIILSLATTNAYAEIEIKFDRFTNKTTVSSPVANQLVSRADTALTPNWFATYTGKKPTELLSGMALTFWKINKSWEYLQCHSAAMLADGLPFPLAKSTHSGTVGRGYVVERIKVPFTLANVKKLSEAKLVEFKICNTEGRFSEDDLQDLREFIKALTP